MPEKLLISILLSQFSRNVGYLWVFHQWSRSVGVMAIKDAFSWSLRISYLGSFLVFSGGISMISIVQILLNILKTMIRSEKNRNTMPKIRKIGTKNVFDVLSEKMYHLRTDLTDFVKMSSIHGVHKLTGGVKVKIFWLIAIAVASMGFSHHLRNLFEIIPRNTVSYDLDDEMRSVNEVDSFIFNNFITNTSKCITDPISNGDLLSRVELNSSQTARCVPFPRKL